MTTSQKEITQSHPQSKILIVTETPTRFDAIASELEKIAPLRLTRASGVLVAITRIKPDVVITDLNKSKQFESITQAIALYKIPIILVGGHVATPVIQAEAVNNGAFDYIQLSVNASFLVMRTVQLIDFQQRIRFLEKEANHDTLSGLPNRREFRIALAKEVERWRRYGVPCTLMAIDIDHMKVINDTHGHPGGDLAIRQIGKVLREVSRDGDTPARLGGEEFALLLAGVTYDKALKAGERLCALVASQPVTPIGSITVSIGVACCPIHAQSEKDLYLASDTALYRAKNDGRNRAVLAETTGG